MMMKSHKPLFWGAFLFGAVLLLLFAPLSSDSSAEPVYSWTDADGKLHFSTNAENPSAKSSALPSVRRENIDQRIKQIRENTPNNCLDHGGIDCAQGADKDGSVICLDGFRQAIAPFRFECTEVRLEAQFFVLLEGQEVPVKHSKNLHKRIGTAKISAFQASIRNLSNTPAEGMTVNFLAARKHRVKAEGPERVEAFGNADYTLALDQLPEPLTMSEIEHTGFEVKCTNCAGILSGR